MRVFVTGTGRCGSVTFSKAAAHCNNYTVGHESKAPGIADWDYPDGHIEVNPQLVVAIPILRRRYPEAKWVHLIRGNRLDCADSLASLNNGDVMRAFSYVFFQHPHPGEIMAAAIAFYDCITSLVDALAPDAFRLSLECAKRDWRACWDYMGCKGDYVNSLAEWNIRHNARKHGIPR